MTTSIVSRKNDLKLSLDFMSHFATEVPTPHHILVQGMIGFAYNNFMSSFNDVCLSRKMLVLWLRSYKRRIF